VVDGEAAKVYNLWGDRIIKDNQHLWFLVKSVDRSKETHTFTFKSGAKWSSASYRIDPQAYAPTHPRPTPSMVKQGLIFCDRPVQVVPWTSAIKDAPTGADLEYFDEFGTRHTGERIYVGQVRGVGPSDQYMAAPGAYHDAYNVTRCPLVTININRYGIKKHLL